MTHLPDGNRKVLEAAAALRLPTLINYSSLNVSQSLFPPFELLAACFALLPTLVGICSLTIIFPKVMLAASGRNIPGPSLWAGQCLLCIQGNQTKGTSSVPRGSVCDDSMRHYAAGLALYSEFLYAAILLYKHPPNTHTPQPMSPPLCHHFLNCCSLRRDQAEQPSHPEQAPDPRSCVLVPPMGWDPGDPGSSREGLQFSAAQTGV